MHTQITYLASSYFHQDYDLEADSPLGVVELFRESEEPATAQALAAEITTLLASPDATEDRLAEIWLDEAQAAYDPRRDGVSVRDWLSQVAGALS
ncbi:MULTISPECIES: contact-dependent growth inhibition system immunity protein [Streptomyces]|uniref:Contact-dependent growth inhibition system immunity protein n=1 Tax=Streptomyces flaveolus TaxID=67297 RepID=A0ABV3AGS7_9ACTN|nr:MULTISPECIES: contact-dependent growth inhibition system immunity protein [Streptomyces]KMS88039.1 hypothetical protein ACZ91_28420 [Streptomyces regensis]KOV92022.1 hypothetical protein ADL02_12225 [Streptomyces sp. NRRL WC-3723]MBG7702891.1 hypothetical protein [Streptomyces sp. MC1]